MYLGFHLLGKSEVPCKLMFGPAGQNTTPKNSSLGAWLDRGKSSKVVYLSSGVSTLRIKFVCRQRGCHRERELDLGMNCDALNVGRNGSLLKPSDSGGYRYKYLAALL